MLLEEGLDKCQGVATMADGVLDIEGHLSKCLIKVIRLEDRIPAERVIASWFNDLTIAASCEDNWLGVRTFAEGKDALSVGSLIIKVLDHLPETFTAYTAEEVLTVMDKKGD